MSPVSTAPDANASCATTRCRNATLVATPTISYSASASREAPQRRRPVLAVDDQLRDHRVVVRRDLVARANAGVHAHRRALRRRAQVRERADRRQEAALRILGVDARLDRMPGERELVLALRQRLARRDAELPFDEVLAGDHLGDRMLDLEPRVHLHEVERAVAANESAAMNSTVPAPT